MCTVYVNKCCGTVFHCVIMWQKITRPDRKAHFRLGLNNKNEVTVRRNSFTTNLLLAATLTLGAAQVQALTELSDDSLSAVQGAGFAFALDNFSMRFAPESFIELTGAPVNGVGWQRGDARYYGLSMTNGAQELGTDWYAALTGNSGGCSGSDTFGNTFLACPIGAGNTSLLGVTQNEYGIGAMASVYDPYVLRVYDYSGYDYQGENLGVDPGTVKPTILELIGPSNTDDWRWSFWGELEVDRVNNESNYSGTYENGIGAPNNSVVGSGGADFLQSQTIIHGKPTTVDGKPAILRLMQTANDADQTLGITYQSALSGDFRFSVRQTGGSPDTLHNVPDFDDDEGMYFKNVDAFLPLGVLHYQTLTLDAVRDGSGDATGNFVIELTRIPNIPQVYNHFYCGDVGNTGNCALSADGSIANPNEDTRGYVRWGNFDNDDINLATLPGANDPTNGIYFVSPTSATPAPTDVTNIGISRIEGMRIHHMKITTLGANQQ